MVDNENGALCFLPGCDRPATCRIVWVAPELFVRMGRPDHLVVSKAWCRDCGDAIAEGLNSQPVEIAGQPLATGELVVAEVVPLDWQPTPPGGEYRPLV
jgi:hypothetical protein